jgi:hypothetical protein
MMQWQLPTPMTCSFHMRWKKREGQFVDPTIGVQNVLGIMQITLTLFKILTNFTLKEWSLPLEPKLDPHMNFSFIFIFSYRI